MHFNRSQLIPVVISGVVVVVFFSQVRPVEAKMNRGSSALAKSVFSEGSLPRLGELRLLQTGGAGNSLAQAEAPLPEGKGKALALKYCSTCHATNVWTKQRHTAEEWSSVIDNMVSRGLVAPDADIDAITDYLAASFGPVKKDAPPASSSPQ